MHLSHLLQYALFLVVVSLCVKPVGLYVFRVFDHQKTWLDFALRPVESLLYRLCGIDRSAEMDWKQYLTAFVIFTGVGAVQLAAILLMQHQLPWYDSDHLTTPMTADLAANTAISFATTTTWQAYGGETTMSYLSQMAGLAAQNFLGAAAGLAVGIAFIRGFARQNTNALGNFWVDVTRAVLWILLPSSIIGGLILVWQGVPMNFAPYVHAETLEGGAQIIAHGPVAAFEAIKNLGTNGGGFFNTNGAHPYENPTALTNLLEMWMIAIVPAALTYTFGRMTGQPRQGWMLYGVMVLLFIGGLIACGWAEQAGGGLAGGNMEGKEVRFGIHGSVLAAVTTSNGATGSYNSMHDSYSAIGGMVPLVNMLLGEIVFGGLGTGLCGMVMMVLLCAFIGGLMIGRTPTYLGKQIGAPEMKLAALYMIIGSACLLSLTAIAVATDWGRTGLTTNDGAHGFTGILFAYASSFANNGQNFAGLSANSIFYNMTTGLAMLVGRLGPAALALALAGHLVEQNRKQTSAGSLPTDTPTFALLLLSTIIVLVALGFLPSLATGPLSEHFRGVDGP